jgi:hypothetical protein
VHEKLRERTGIWLAHRRERVQATRARQGPDLFGLDKARVGQFVDGTLSARDEDRLAEEVAELLPHTWDLPYKSKESLALVAAHLGGQDQMMLWLDRHPGLPRVTARTYTLLGVLNEYSDDPGVISALRTRRERDPYPAALHDYLPAQTNAETLSGLAYHVDDLLSRKQEKEAAALAGATADWVRQAIADETDPTTRLRELSTLLAHAHTDITEAAAPHS